MEEVIKIIIRRLLNEDKIKGEMKMMMMMEQRNECQ